MEQDELKDQANEPISGYGKYSYADYLNWQFEEMVELIRGKVFRNAAAPRRIHQEISGKVFTKIHNFLDHHPCKVYEAPFDVRLPARSKRNEDIDTVVQPDICVICDMKKLDDLGCVGAPDLIIEILSPGNNKKELVNKYEVYEEAGVKEYWVIHPSEQSLLIYILIDGKYQSSRLFTSGHHVEVQSLPGFRLDLEYVFKDLE